MTTTRVFTAFARDGRHGLGMARAPADGFCISAFLILRDASDPARVLMGHLDPSFGWDHIGALDRERADAHSRGWMLPSSHLIYGESPHSAARRILDEQLGIEGLPLSEPRVFSEVYTPRRHPKALRHWDLQFAFEGELDERGPPPVHPAWVDLAFLDASKLKAADVARSHEDILARLP